MVSLKNSSITESLICVNQVAGYIAEKIRVMKTGTYIVWNGFLMFIGISGLFLILKGLGLGHVTELRFLNVVIVGFFSNRMAARFNKEPNEHNFIGSMFNIFMANVLAVIFTVIAFVFYIFGVDPGFKEDLQAWILLAGNDLSGTEAAIGIFLEGVAGSVIISFVVMQHWSYVKPEKRTIKTARKLKKV